MVIGITGHANLETPFGKSYNPEIYDKEIFKKVFLDIKNKLIEYDKITCCSGMARGVDEIFALVAIELNLDLILCIPGDLTWHKNLKTHKERGKAQAINYEKILSYKNLIKIIEVPRVKGKNVFNLRNQVIVDNSDIVHSYHLFKSLGTMDCIQKAKIANKYRSNLYINSNN